MDLEKEILRRLKIEVAALEAAMKQKDRQLLQMEEEHKRLLIAVALKFGTMVAPNTMELTVSSVIGSSGTYDVTITNHPKRNEHTVRVRRG